MSDESSTGSPRIKAPDLKTKPRDAQLPWWAEEDEEDDNKKREAARQSWIKPKTSKPEVNKPEPDVVDHVSQAKFSSTFFICIDFASFSKLTTASLNGE